MPPQRLALNSTGYFNTSALNSMYAVPETALALGLQEKGTGDSCRGYHNDRFITHHLDTWRSSIEREGEGEREKRQITFRVCNMHMPAMQLVMKRTFSKIAKLGLNSA